MANIFISHSSKDNQKTKQIFNSLKNISNSIFLDFDTKGHGLKGGDDWKKQLYLRIKKARIMIVALSPNWLDSQWCYKEYCMARVLRKKIIPVVIESDKRIASWDGIDIQYFDTTNDLNAIEKLQERISELTQSDISKIYDIRNIDAPFVGLRSFNQNEAGIFYGRSEETLNAIDRFNGMADSQNEKFLNIIGASGVGKSSFLKAGILPLLQHFHKESWYLLPIFRAKQEILLNLAKTFSIANDSTAEVLKKLENSEFKSLFDELELYIYDEIRKQNLKTKDLKILLPIDQAEEILSSTNQAQKEQFFKILHYLLEKKSNFFVVWTLRSDHLKKYQDEALLEFLHQQDETLLLKPIASKELKNIIQEPAYTADVHIEEAVVEEIKEDIRSSTSLPLLAHLLQTLYSKTKSKAKKQIILNDYKALSSEGRNPIENIINEQAEKIYKNIKDESLVQELFLNHLIKVNSDESVIKQSANLNAIPLKQQEIAEQFVAKRLFVKDGDGSEVATIEIAHEALISSWERLVNWIEAEKEFLLFRNHLELLYREWRESNEDERALLKDLNLEKALSFKSKLVREEEIGFVELSFEYEEAQRKKRRNFLLGVGGVISSLGAFSAFKWFDAEEARAIASEKSIRLEKQKVLLQEEVEKAKHNVGLALLEKAKLALTDDDRAKANLFAYGALEVLSDRLDVTWARVGAREIIYSYAYIKLVYRLETKQNLLSYISISNDSNIIATGFIDGNIKFFDLKNSHLLKTFDGHKKRIIFLSFSRDNKTIISISEDGNIIFSDIKSEKIITLQHTHFNSIISITISNDFKKVFFALLDKTIKIWDIESEKVLMTLIGHESVVNNIVVSYDNTLIVSCADDGYIKIWDISSGKILKTLESIGSFISNVLISKDNKTILATIWNKIKVWDINSGILLESVYAGKKELTNLVISKDGKQFISSSVDGYIKIWDMKYRTILKILFSQHSINHIVISKNNNTIISNGLNNIIQVWDNKSTEFLTALTKKESGITSIDISKDEKKIVLALENKTIEVLDSLSGKVMKTLYGHDAGVWSVVILDDNQTIISASADKTIKIWDIKSGLVKQTLNGHKDGIRSIAISSDNERIFSNGYDDYIKIWDIKTGKLINSTFVKDYNGRIMRILEKQKIMIVALNYNIEIVDTNSKKILKTLKGHKNSINHIVISKDEKVIFSASNDKTVKIWDIKSGAILGTLTYNGRVKSITISDDSKTIITVLDNNKVQILKLDLKDVEKEKAQLEQQLQSKLNGIKLVPTKIPYTKPLWSKYHPNHWLLKLEEAKNETQKAKAMYELGLIYDRDNENQKALEWYKKSAQKGYKKAEERVVFLEGWMRENGW